MYTGNRKIRKGRMIKFEKNKKYYKKNTNYFSSVDV